jgi:transposase-like protein
MLDLEQVVCSQRAKKTRVKGDPNSMLWREFQELERRKRIQLIQELIPIGLMAVSEELQKEVEELLSADQHAKQPKGLKKFGSNPGTVRLGDRILPVRVPRLRSEEGEVTLESYKILHGHPELDSQSVFRKVSKGVSTRSIESVLQPSTGSIGASKSSISRKAVEETQKLLKCLQERSLKEFRLAAIFIDGTSFASDQMIIALGVDLEGHKKVLGFIQSSTESSEPISELLRSILARGLHLSEKILACIDGSKGIAKAVKTVFGDRALIQRCQWHKRENVASYLPKSEQVSFKKRLQAAYDRPTYSEARSALKELELELAARNQNAERSLQEGFEEVLTLHRLGMFAVLGISFKTTNCIESLNSQAKSYCRRIRRWKNSSQKQRWLAAALLELEPTLRKVKGCAQMPNLVEAMKTCKKT